MKELHWNRYNAAADLDPFPDIRYQCPVCYKSFKEEYDECPNCGLVMKRTCDNCNKVHCFIGSPGSGGCHWEKKKGILQCVVIMDIVLLLIQPVLIGKLHFVSWI